VSRDQIFYPVTLEDIRYTLVANDLRAGEPVNILAASGDLFLPLATNSGYGRAVKASMNKRAARGWCRLA
jgi:hypothetical protein